MSRESFNVDFKRCFISGLAALLPIALTVFVLWQLFKIVPPLSDLLFSWVFGEDTRINRILSAAVSMLIVILVVYLVGRLAVTYIGRLVLSLLEKFMVRFPVIRAIYPYAKQITDFIFSDKTKRFGRAVAVEYPRKGVYSVGFITSESPVKVCEHTGRKFVNIFIPSSPTPFTGYVIFVPEDEVIDLNMTADEALRLTVSGGVIVPGRIGPVAMPGQDTADDK